MKRWWLWLQMQLIAQLKWQDNHWKHVKANCCICYDYVSHGGVDTYSGDQRPKDDPQSKFAHACSFAVTNPGKCPIWIVFMQCNALNVPADAVLLSAEKSWPVLKISARVETASAPLYKILVLQWQVFVESFKLLILRDIWTNSALKKRTFKSVQRKYFHLWQPHPPRASCSQLWIWRFA